MTITKYWRLVGTKGPRAAVGEVTEVKDGMACWKLHPAYATWFWPLMRPTTALALEMPEKLLEPAQEGDCTDAPRNPTEPEKDKLLKEPEREEDLLRVYTLVLQGKPASVHKAFPTRTVSLSALRYCRTQVTAKAGPKVSMKDDMKVTAKAGAKDDTKVAAKSSAKTSTKDDTKVAAKASTKATPHKAAPKKAAPKKATPRKATPRKATSARKR